MLSSNDHQSSSSHPAPHIRRNQQVLASRVRVISQDGRDLGIMKTDDARKAASSAGLDLVEIARTAVPPVCKIFDFEAWLKVQKN